MPSRSRQTERGSINGTAQVPNAGHPYGVRGVGEVPIVPPLAAIGNAIHDATSVRVTHLPASPRWLLDQLERAGE